MEAALGLLTGLGLADRHGRYGLAGRPLGLLATMVLEVALGLLTGLVLADRHGRYGLAGRPGPAGHYGAGGGPGHTYRPWAYLPALAALTATVWLTGLGLLVAMAGGGPGPCRVIGH